LSRVELWWLCGSRLVDVMFDGSSWPDQLDFEGCMGYL
jgi:hypothetical protein